MRNAKAEQNNGEIEELLRDLLITSLGAAGVKQLEIRKIVGCNMNRVSRIVKHIQRRNIGGQEKD
jgi:hypothetical protein